MESKIIKCSKCGTDNPDNSKYCRGCGYELPKVVIEKAVASQPVQSKKKVSLGLTIGLVLTGILVGFIFGIIIGIVSTYFYLNAVP